jgi:hypothetical protein
MAILKKYFPVFIFLSFTLLLMSVTVFYAPSWGLMDAGLLLSASNFWSSNELLREVVSIINHDVYFMPFSRIWYLINYHVFRDAPLFCYISIILENMIGLFLWGIVLHKVFSEKKDNFWLDSFLFPLTLFLFTPFWNIFMYIALQEKFIFLFSAISMYFTKKYLDTERGRYFLVSLIFIVLTVLSKPQGVYIILVYILYSCFLLATNKKREIGILLLTTNLSLLISYYLFTVKYQLHGYASRYNLSLAVVMGNFMNAPFIIKFLAVVAIFMVFYIVYNVLKKNDRFLLEAVFIPLGFLCYITVLLPWGIINYHLSVVAPYAVGMFFPIYSYCNGKSRSVRLVINCLILFLVLITFIYIIRPRISKMADIKKTVVFLKDFSSKQIGSRYFFPPPFVESAYSMSVFTGLKIIYVEKGILSDDMLGDGVNSFLIFDDQDPSIDLAGVRVEKEIYRNDNWRVYEIRKSKNFKTRFDVKFKTNLMERFKVYFKKLK